MGTALIGSKIKKTYKDLLHLDHSNAGIDETLRPLVDGGGGDTPLHISADGIGVGALGTGDAPSGTGFGWMRFGSDDPDVSYNIGASVHEAGGTQNNIFMLGWNCRYVNEKPYVPTEHAWYIMFESNYDAGELNVCEWYLEYFNPTGSVVRRPFMFTTDRSTNEVVGQFTGECLFYNNAHDTENFAIREDGSGVEVRRGSVHINTTAGNSVLTAMNNAGNNSIDLIKHLSDDRIFLPRNTVIMSVDADKQVLELMGATSQGQDMLKMADVGGNTLSHFNHAGHFMTRKTSAPSDGDIVASEMALWFDDTDGGGKLMIKGKTVNGTVVAGEVALT